MRKKRICNMFAKGNRKKAMSTAVGFIIILLMAGCSREEQGKNDRPSLEASEIMPEEKSLVDNVSEDDILEDNALEDNVLEDNVLEDNISEEENTANSIQKEQGLSEDAQEIKNAALGFAEGYFTGDRDVIKQFLTDPYEWDMDVYANGEAKEISAVEVKGIEGIENKAIGDVHIVYLIYKETAAADSNKNLTLELIKTLQGWKIQFYGIEG